MAVWELSATGDAPQARCSLDALAAPVRHVHNGRSTACVVARRQSLLGWPRPTGCSACRSFRPYRGCARSARLRHLSVSPTILAPERSPYRLGRRRRRWDAVAHRMGGSAWRFHNRRYPADDPGGSLRVSGRYNLGLDSAPASRAFAALYLGLTIEDLCDDFNYDQPRQLARAARNVGAEGLLVPSATRLGNNLVLFPADLRSGSTLTVIGSVDPKMYVDRASV